MSQRLLIWIVGLSATGIAVLARLTGLFHALDEMLFRGLGLAHLPSAFPLAVEIGCILLSAFGIIIIELGVASWQARVGLGLAALLQPISAVAVGVVAGLRISPFPWMLAIILPVAAATIYRATGRGRRERVVGEIFGKNVSARARESLAREGNFETQKTVFATIWNARFTGEKSAAVENAVNDLRESGAWVEQQAGNRLLAVWNAPLPIADAAAHAVRKTLEYAENWQIGVVSGDLLCGVNAENAWQMQGEVFERASALEQANSTFGSTVLLDLATADALSDAILLRPIDLFAQPGQAFGSEIYQPLALRQTASQEILAERDAFWNALILFRQKRFSEAMAAFRQSGSDPVVQTYLRRIENLTSAS